MATICSKVIAHGRQRWRLNEDGSWSVLTYGSHGPNDPPVGLSWKWHFVSEDRVPNEVKEAAK